MYEQSKQICAVNVCDFGELPQPQPAVVADDNKTLLEAVKFLRPIAEAYAAGQIKKTDLKNYKDEKLIEAGIKKPSKSAKMMKRPSAAEASGDAEVKKPKTKNEDNASSSAVGNGRLEKAEAKERNQKAVDDGPDNASSSAVGNGPPGTTKRKKSNGNDELVGKKTGKDAKEKKEKKTGEDAKEKKTGEDAKAEQTNTTVKKNTAENDKTKAKPKASLGQIRTLAVLIGGVESVVFSHI